MPTRRTSSRWLSFHLRPEADNDDTDRDLVRYGANTDSSRTSLLSPSFAPHPSLASEFLEHGTVGITIGAQTANHLKPAVRGGPTQRGTTSRRVDQLIESLESTME